MEASQSMPGRTACPPVFSVRTQGRLARSGVEVDDPGDDIGAAGEPGKDRVDHVGLARSGGADDEGALLAQEHRNLVGVRAHAPGDAGQDRQRPVIRRVGHLLFQDVDGGHVDEDAALVDAAGGGGGAAVRQPGVGGQTRGLGGDLGVGDAAGREFGVDGEPGAGRPHLDRQNANGDVADPLDAVDPFGGDLPPLRREFPGHLPFGRRERFQLAGLLVEADGAGGGAHADPDHRERT